MRASRRAVPWVSLAIFWLPLEGFAVCTGIPLNDLCDQPDPEAFCAQAGVFCTNLEPSNVSVSYSSATGEYSYSLEVCNTDGAICAESNQVSQVMITLSSFENCPDVEQLVPIDTNAHPIDVGTCVDSSDIPELAGTLTSDCLHSDTFCFATIQVDVNNAFCEDDEDDNNVAAAISTDVPPDLRFLNGVACTEGTSPTCDDSNPNTMDVRYQFTIENHSCGSADVSSAVYKRELFNSQAQDKCMPADATASIPGPIIGPAETRDFDICLSAASSCAYKCCSVVLDEENTVGEDVSTTESNKANDNILQAHLVIDGQPHTIDAMVINSASVSAELTSVVTTPLPPNWISLSVTPSTGVIPAGEEAAITLTYEAGSGARGHVITVVTTNSSTGWTQDNIFIISDPIPALPPWGLAALAVVVFGSAAIGRSWVRRRS